MPEELHRLSPYNPSAPLAGAAVLLNDCTLREGEQSSEAAFSVDDRCRIADALVEAGVGRLQIGLRRGAALDNQAIVRAAGHTDTEVLVLAFLPDWKQQIDVAIDAGASHVNVIHRTSPPLLALLGISVDELIEASVAALEYAREQGAHTIYSPGDTMRADWATLELAYKAAARAGAEAVYVLDTVGVAAPAAIGEVVRRAVAASGLPVGIHAHNDLGLALANALAALEAGASVIDTCVNGMGDRCGNPATDEVAVACELLYGAGTGVRLRSLRALSELVAELSGVPIAPSKPLVGTNAYSHKLDIHVRATLADPLAFQPVRPELVGGASRVVVGRNSGPLVLATKLGELGAAPLDDEQAGEALKLVDRYAIDHKRSVPDDELLRIADRVRG